MNKNTKKKKLTKEFKSKWLNALSSGRYKKGVGSLKNFSKNTYCCVGVACRMFNISASDLELKGHISEVCPVKVRDTNDYKVVSQHQNNLVNLNDNNDTWDKVIAYIKKNM